LTTALVRIRRPHPPTISVIPTATTTAAIIIKNSNLLISTRFADVEFEEWYQP
jgi:hypothetical protein